jgi:hypothetical protein
MMMIVKPIDYKDIAKQSGKPRGRLAYSKTFNSFCVSDGDYPQLALIDCPFGEPGDILDGHIIKTVRIKDDQWIFDVEDKK